MNELTIINQSGQQVVDSRQQESLVHKNQINMDKLLQFLCEEDEDGTLLPVFTLLLEVCFESKKHGLEKFKI